MQAKNLNITRFTQGKIILLNIYFILIIVNTILLITFILRRDKKNNNIDILRLLKYVFAAIIISTVTAFQFNFGFDLTNQNIKDWIEVATYYNNILTPALLLSSIILLYKTLTATKAMNAIAGSQVRITESQLKNEKERANTAMVLDFYKSRIQNILDLEEKHIHPNLKQRAVFQVISFCKNFKHNNKDQFYCPIKDIEAKANINSIEEVHLSDYFRDMDDIKIRDIINTIDYLNEMNLENETSKNEAYESHVHDFETLIRISISYDVIKVLKGNNNVRFYCNDILQILKMVVSYENAKISNEAKNLIKEDFNLILSGDIYLKIMRIHNKYRPTM